MRAISVPNPQATEIAKGQRKRLIMRFSTDHRGLVLICSSKWPRIEPAGYALAVGNLVGVSRKKSLPGALEPRWWWIFGEVHAVTRFPVTGQPELFEVPYGVTKMETLREQA